MQPLRRSFAAALAVLLLTGCGDELMAPEQLPAHLQAPQLSLESWEVVARDGFSFRLPPGFVKSDAVPVDSDAANYTRDGDDLHYDYGLYSSPWRPSANLPVSDITEARVWLGGRPAQLVSYRLEGRWVVRAWWGSVGRSGIGELDLVVRGESVTLEGRRDLLAVIHSVRFD
jgi:hypothetical protein